MRSGRRELSLESSVRFSNLVHVGRARGFQAHLAFFLSVGLQVSGGGAGLPLLVFWTQQRLAIV